MPSRSFRVLRAAPSDPAARAIPLALLPAGLALVLLGAACRPAAAGEIVAQLFGGVRTSPGMRMETRSSSPSHASQPGDGKAADAASAPASAASVPGKKPVRRLEALPTIDPLATLRQRLAEKLGAKTSADGRNAYVMRNAAPGEAAESGASVVTAPRAVRHATAHAAAASTAAHPAGPWSYSGETGPAAWGQLNADYGLCAKGTRQSPIDIRDGLQLDLEAIQFDYRPGAFSVRDNGRTVQVNVAPGNSITVTGRRYDLVAFDFQRPAEERIDGRQFALGVHLVHKSADGHTALVALLFDGGAAQPVVQSVWNNLPLEKNEDVAARGPLDPAQLLPEDRRYYTYMGSLTTPPCSEGVLWIVMKQAMTVSPAQLGIFARLHSMNARPVQATAGRMIKESN